jgi:hypothetical protein
MRGNEGVVGGCLSLSLSLSLSLINQASELRLLPAMRRASVVQKK